MEDKVFKYVISLILCVILFMSETLLLIQYNVSKGIRKEDVIKIIDNFDIEDEFKKMDDYYKVKNIIGEEPLEEIINSEELNRYVKENAKSMYLKIIYGEKVNYISNEELTEYINNKLDSLQEINNITETDKKELLNIIDKIINDIENSIEESNNIGNLNIIEKFMSSKTTTYLMLITLTISATIILINKSKNGLIFIGLPTLITGILFLILELTLTRKLYVTGIDRSVIYAVNNYLPNMIKTLKKSSIIMTTIGFIECALYTILNFQEVGNKNGEI